MSSRSQPMRIGITQRVDVVGAVHERRDALDQQWGRLLSASGYHPVPIPNLLEHPARWIEDMEIGGLLLSGGNDLAAVAGARNTAPERDLLEAALLDLAAARHIPVLGVCRGMQMIVHHWCGKVEPVPGHVRVTHTVLRADGCMLPIHETESVNSFHDLGVTSVDPDGNLMAAAIAEDGTIEAVTHRHLPVWGIMWHPERGEAMERDRAIIAARFGRDGR